MRYFTVSEANALLPSLEPQVRRLQQLYRSAQEKFRELELIKAVGTGPDGRLIMAYDYKLAKTDLQALVSEINEVIAHINALGCELKHIEQGLVDFPAILNGGEVLLCWKLGEPAVAYYHGLCDGYKGRKPIPEHAAQPHTGDDAEAFPESPAAS